MATCTVCDVPKVSAQYILTCNQRPPLYKGHYEVALAWPFNTGFTVVDFDINVCLIPLLYQNFCCTPVKLLIQLL